MEDFSNPTSEERHPTAETEPHTSEEPLEDSEELDDTSESVQHTPETDTAEVTSDSMEEHSARTDSLADEISIYYPGSEDPEMSDSDDLNLYGLSQLSPDPSLGCLPRRFPKQRSTTWTYKTPEEPRQQRAWNYLVERNIIELLEEITAELFLHRVSPPIDYLIEAIKRARQRNEEKKLAEQKSTRGDGDVASTSTDSPNIQDGGDAPDSGLIINSSLESCMNIVIHDDVSACDDTTGDVTSPYGDKTDSGEKGETRDYVDDEGDVMDMVTCFPLLASPQVDTDLETEVKEHDVISLAGDESNQSPRVITSTEALKLLSYLS